MMRCQKNIKSLIISEDFVTVTEDTARPASRTSDWLQRKRCFWYSAVCSKGLLL